MVLGVAVVVDVVVVVGIVEGVRVVVVDEEMVDVDPVDEGTAEADDVTVDADVEIDRVVEDDDVVEGFVVEAVDTAVRCWLNQYAPIPTPITAPIPPPIHHHDRLFIPSRSQHPTGLPIHTYRSHRRNICPSTIRHHRARLGSAGHTNQPDNG